MSRSLASRLSIRLSAYIGGSLTLLAIMAAPAFAQLPATQLGSLFPAGSQPGKTFDAAISGGNLDDVDKLQFSHPGITAVQKTREPNPFEKGPQPVPNQFVVTVKNDVPIGLYEVRATGKYGMSNPRAFVIGDLPEVVETESNNKPDEATEFQLGSVINGRANGNTDVDYYRFAAKKGQRILLDCWARRIDSRMDANVVVFDPSGRELGNSRDTRRRDPLVDFTASSDGEYVVKVYDTRYQGNSDYFYRLAVGTFPYVDFVFPPAGLAGSKGQYTVFGRNLPGGSDAGISVGGRPLQKATATIALPNGAGTETLSLASLIEPEGTGVDGIEYRVKGPQGVSNPALVGIATAPVLIEKEPNNKPEQAQKVSLPCEYVGQFYPRGDRDWVTFDAKQGDVYTVEVISQRLGLQTDPSIVIQQVTTNEKGEQQVKVIQTIDDFGGPFGGDQFNTATDDPVLRFTVPADATYRVLLRDALSALRSDPRNVYRLAIRSERPDFRLVAVGERPSGALLLRKGGNASIRVIAHRRDNFQGEIVVSVSGLPKGVTCPGAIIGPGRGSATLALSTAENAAPASGLIQITGKAKIGQTEVTRTARYGTGLAAAPRQNNQPMRPSGTRMARSLAVSVSAVESEPYTLNAGEIKIYEVSRATKLTIPYVMTRRGNFKANVVYSPIDFPPNVTTPGNKFTVNNKTTKGQFQLDIKNNAPVGTFTLSLRGQAQVSYSRNPEASKAAAERKKELDKIASDAAAVAKKAAQAKANTDKAATAAATAVKNATTAKQAADKVAAVAVAATKTAADKAAAAKSAAAKNPKNKGLATASTNAAKAAADATTKAKTDAEKATAAAKALTDATAKAKTANEAKAKTDKAAQEAAAKNKAAAAAKAETDKRAKATATAAKAKNVQVFRPSTVVRIKITEGPVTVQVASPKAGLKQGAKLEVPVTIARLYGFADQVTLSISVPKGVGGLSIPKAPIAKGQTQGKLTITANAKATPGTHTLNVNVAIKYNKQNLTISRPIAVKVEKVEPPKKPAKKKS